jgi:YbgC/YbaW family acyl-CoA thioester hydrolase
MSRLWLYKKVHWSDTDAAGIVWFPNYFGWFEDAEEELYAVVLGRHRQALLDEHRFAMPRVEASATYQAPVRPGQLIRIGMSATVENPRRLRYDFEMRIDGDDILIAKGFVRVACVDGETFTPRDFPSVVTEMVAKLESVAERQDVDRVNWV